MKVYYQRIDKTTCYFSSIDSLESALETEIDSFYCGNDTVNDEELGKMHESITSKIKELELNKEIECCEAFWGVCEMSEDEFNNLDEFEGF